MGLYDRDYGRSDQRTPWDRVQSPRSITITLIVINVVIFFADTIFAKPNGLGVKESVLVPWFAVEAATLVQPWKWFQFLTYGFLHDIGELNHVLFNMIGLFFFGRIIEQRLGRMEFLRFYFVAIIAGGIIGAAGSLLEGWASGFPLAAIGQFPYRTIGASGAVVATVVLFACYYPHQEILLMFVFPVKAWVLAVLFVGMDLAGALGIFGEMGGQSNTAFTVHLAGAFFALGYYFRGWSLRRLDLSAIGGLSGRLRQRSRRMKLKLHDPEKKLEQEAGEADRILDKIHQLGESSLTSSERKTLERYSRRQREKRDQ
jgi:membrane associated rhomboid family serine protease